jgi:flagellar M-ring protein FliF
MATFEPWIARAKSLWLTLTPSQRVVVAVVLAGGFVAAAYLAIAPTTIAYAPLYKDLAAGDLREIQQVLGKDGVPFRQDDRSGTLEVPSEQIEKVRMRLASEGLPRQGGPGFEIFEQSRLGETEFDQKIQMQRALEGELARTIRGLDSVEAVRVHLVLAAHEMFRSDESPASASVVLRLHAGRGLTATQVGGIVHLVSSAVRGLEPGQVTVIDQHGTLLTPSPGRGADGAATDANLADNRRAYEADLERRIEALVVPIVGSGHVVARVGVEFDTTRRETSEVRYDPDTTAILSETRSEEKQA